MKKAYLILGNGEIFEGERIGADGSCMGELVFTTGMEGYLETLTDPSYAGQIRNTNLSSHSAITALLKRILKESRRFTDILSGNAAIPHLISDVSTPLTHT